MDKFWQEKSLQQMTEQEWESLCDGCGKCCLHKLEDYDTGAVHYTNVACRLLDVKAGGCKKYAERKRIVANCLQLRQDLDKALKWLPPSCSYKLLSEGKDLPEWHPLQTGKKDSCIKADKSVIGLAISEKDAGDYEDHVIECP